MPTGRVIGLSTVALLVVAALLWGFRPRPIAVDTAEVVRGPLEISVEEEGKTRVKERYVLHAPVAGHMRRIDLDVGGAVALGEVLVVLEPASSAVLDPRSRAEAEAGAASAHSALERAEAEQARAEAEAELARQEFERREELLARQLISRSERDQAEAQMRARDAARRAAVSAVAVARHNLQAARARLEYSAATRTGEAAEQVSLRSPVDGRVLGLMRESAGVVSAGEALLAVGDPAALEVEVEVLSKDAVRIPPGGRVLLERWGGDGPLEGVVRSVEPAGFTKVSALGVEEQRVLVIADLASPPQDWARLGDGYRVEARFVVWRREDAVIVPSSALFRRDGGWAVFVAAGSRARLREVEVGRSDGLRAEILGGLEPGDRVVVHPDDELDDGVKIRPFGDEAR
jgi:HlyD family secretion protein